MEVLHDLSAFSLKSWRPDAPGRVPQAHLAGQALPREVGQVLPQAMRVLCVGPAEWLLLAEGRSASTILERIHADLEREELVAVEISDALGIIRIAGPCARQLLAKGCGLDLHPRRFPPDRCARTRFAGLALTIECLDPGPSFQLYAERSALPWLLEWLEDAASEFRAL